MGPNNLCLYIGRPSLNLEQVSFTTDGHNIMIDKGEIKEEDQVNLFEKRKMWVPRKTLLQRRGHDKTD